MMANDIDAGGTFAERVFAIASERAEFQPSVFHNTEGDCLEILLEDEGYYAERADSLVTVFIGRDSGRIVGAVIKGIQRIVERALEDSPGFRVEIMEVNSLRIEYLLSVVFWSRESDDSDGAVVKRYKRLRTAADKANLCVDLREAVC